MATLTANKGNIVVTCQSKALILRTDGTSGGINVVLEPPNLSGQKADNVEDTTGQSGQEGKPVLGDAPAAIVLASFSSCNTWLVLCSNNKQLSLWNTSAWSILSNRCIVRTASAVKFTSSGRFIVVADKSGDTYTYSVENPLEKGTLILGHLSMLLDVLVTPNDKYIITCDRDEKIRVSNFPNSYNILTYCLGHEQFVSKIDLLPHNQSVLVSSSGDGTIRFWDYESGSSIHTINCLHDLSDNDAEMSEILPVKRFTISQLSENASIICAIIGGTAGCSLFQVSNEQGNVLSSQHLHNLSFNAEPWDILLTDNKLLWTLLPSQEEIIIVYTFNESTKQFVLKPDVLNKQTALAVAFVQEKREWFSSIALPDSFTVFYKRKYDNLLVYHERKKLRTMESGTHGQCPKHVET